MKSSIPVAIFLSRCLRCLVFGRLENDVMMGSTQIDITNTSIILIDAAIPNSISFVEFVNAKVMNPSAVVKFVNKVAVPIF